MTAFRKNPVMLWAHDYNHPPVGSWRDWAIEDDEDGKPALAMTAVFADYDFADTVFKLYEAGHMRAVSIGWTPLEFEEIADDDGLVVGFDFIKNELLECSAVPIPADADALMQASARGIISADAMGRFATGARIGDLSRGEAYVLDHREKRQEEENEVAIKLNEKAIEWAKDAIDKGDYEIDADWEWVEADAKYLLDGGGGEDWDGYSFHFLGRDEDHTYDSHEGWAYPAAKRKEDGRICVYLKALEVIEADATAAGHDDISGEAAGLASYLTEVAASEGDEVEEVEEEVVEEDSEERPLEDEGGEGAVGTTSQDEKTPPPTDSRGGMDDDETDEDEEVEVFVELDEKLRLIGEAIEDMRSICMKSASSEEEGGEGEGGGIPVEEEDTPPPRSMSHGEARALDQKAQAILDSLSATSFEGYEEPSTTAEPKGSLTTHLSTLRSLLSDKDTTRVRAGKKVSAARAEKLAEARGCMCRAEELLDEVLEEVDALEEEFDEIAKESEADVAVDDAPAVVDDSEEAGRSAGLSISDRIERLTLSLDGDEDNRKERVLEALESLANRLGIEQRKSYADDLI
jgi:HK97 family phage prohead protease